MRFFVVLFSLGIQSGDPQQCDHTPGQTFPGGPNFYKANKGAPDNLSSGMPGPGPSAPKSIRKAKSETSLATQEDDKKLSVPTSNQKRSSLSLLTSIVRPQTQAKSVKSLATRSQEKMSNEIAFAALARFITVSDRMSHFRATIETPGSSSPSVHTCKVRRNKSAHSGTKPRKNLKRV